MIIKQPMDSRFNRHNRRKYSLKVHIVLVTKYRKQLLKDSIAYDAEDILSLAEISKLFV